VNRRQLILRTYTIAFALLVSAGIYASQSYKPPTSGEAWKVTKVYCAGMSPGVVAFLCNESEGVHRIQVYVEGLDPELVYALWLRSIDDKGHILKQTRATRKWFAPRSDAEGVYHHVLRASECPVGEYNGLMLSPGANDPSNGVLFGRIVVEQHSDDDDEAAPDADH